MNAVELLLLLWKVALVVVRAIDNNPFSFQILQLQPSLPHCSRSTVLRFQEAYLHDS
jgi:hypothetical protein